MVPIASDIVVCVSKLVKKADFTLSVFTTYTRMPTHKGHRKPCEVLNISVTLVVGIGSQVFASVQIQLIVHIKCVQVFVYQLCSPDGVSGKESACQCRRCKRCRFNPWTGEFPWSGRWQPLQYPCLENSIDRGAWQATVHWDTKSRTQLNT